MNNYHCVLFNNFNVSSTEPGTEPPTDSTELHCSQKNIKAAHKTAFKVDRGPNYWQRVITVRIVQQHKRFILDVCVSLGAQVNCLTLCRLIDSCAFDPQGNIS